MQIESMVTVFNPEPGPPGSGVIRDKALFDVVRAKCGKPFMYNSFMINEAYQRDDAVDGATEDLAFETRRSFWPVSAIRANINSISERE